MNILVTKKFSIHLLLLNVVTKLSHLVLESDQ